MEINGRPIPIVTVELNMAGNGPAGIRAKKEMGTFVDSLTKKQIVDPPPPRYDYRARHLDIMA